MATELTEYGREQILRQLTRTPDELRQAHGLSELINRSIEDIMTNGLDGSRPVEDQGNAIGITRAPGESEDNLRERIRRQWQADFSNGSFRNQIHHFPGGIRPGEFNTISAYTGHGRQLGIPAYVHRRTQTQPTADTEGTSTPPPVPETHPETRRSILEWIRQSDHFKNWLKRDSYEEVMNSGPTAKEMEEDYRV